MSVQAAGHAMTIQEYGALAFGILIGWYLYFVNRYRKGDVQVSDITSVVGAIGGAALLKLFDTTSGNVSVDLFGYYGVGLTLGFFAYFIVLIVLVGVSKNFDSDWFLDGRRKDPPKGYGYGQDIAGTVHPMLTEKET